MTKPDIVWMPGRHSDLNHLYDMTMYAKTYRALCGSTARPQTYNPEWRAQNCAKCVKIADKVHNEEREAEEMGE